MYFLDTVVPVVDCEMSVLFCLVLGSGLFKQTDTRVALGGGVFANLFVERVHCSLF